MKIIKRIVIWSAFALLMQTCIFFIIDKYYEKSLLNTNVKEVRVEKINKPKKNLVIKIPSAAKKIEASFDGKYLSYYEEKNLTIINSYDGTKKVVNAEKNSEQIYSKWLPDVDSMFLCEKGLSQSRNISVFTYNADTNNKQTPTDTNNHDITFALNNTTDTIDNIEMSTTMGIMYIKTLKKTMKSDIFNIDVNGHTTCIFNSKGIGKTSVFKHKPNLIYEDTLNNNIKITNSKWSINNKVCLLNTDNEDNLYLGVLNGEKVTKVLYGTTEKPINSWNTISLQQPLDKNDVIVTKDGKIYTKSTSESSLIDKQLNKKIDYKGNLLKVTDKEILSVEKGKLQRKNLN